LLLTKVKDGRLKAVTVTETEVSPDLKKAVIYYYLNEQTEDRQVEREEITRALEKSTSFFRREICQVLDLKFAPVITFKLDPSVEYGRHMDEVFERLEKDRHLINDD